MGDLNAMVGDLKGLACFITINTNHLILLGITFGKNKSSLLKIQKATGFSSTLREGINLKITNIIVNTYFLN